MKRQPTARISEGSRRHTRIAMSRRRMNAFIGILLFVSLPRASSFALSAAGIPTRSVSVLYRQQRPCYVSMQEDEEPARSPAEASQPSERPPPVYPPPPPKSDDKFIPIFVATALGGYGLILVLDAAMNGFCVPFVGACFGMPEASSGVWGS